MAEALPPLTALRAFEAAARHMSFANAAEELRVTPAALSFQIKSLEEHLGDKLFVRLNRAVDLTEAGRLLAPGVSEGFTSIRRAWTAARRLSNAALTVTAGPAFSAKWLSPRLFAFAEANPGIELRFVASLRKLNFETGGIDLAIRYCTADDDGDLVSHPFMSEFLTPMMSPALVEHYGTAGTLAKAPLLHDDSLVSVAPHSDWPAWCAAAGIEADCSRGPRFAQADQALDAAISGAGVVLGRAALAGTALRSGMLVAPFRIALSLDRRYRVLHKKGAETRPQLRAFLDWLDTETRPMADLEAAHEIVPPPVDA